jgi:hypothetical protein
MHRSQAAKLGLPPPAMEKWLCFIEWDKLEPNIIMACPSFQK